MEPFAEELRIELQRLLDQILRQRILFDEIIGLVPVLDDAVIFVHLLERRHSEVQRVDGMVESVLYLDGLAGILGDIEQHEIVFFQIIPQEQQRMERLRQERDIVDVQEIAVDGVDDIHRLLVEVDDIEPEKYFPRLSDDVFPLFAVYMDAIDIDHDPFAVDVVVFLGGLASVLYDVLEVLEREFLLERLEDVEPEEGEPAFVEHEIMRVFGIFPRFVGDLDEILVQHILENLLPLADLVDAEARM